MDSGLLDATHASDLAFTSLTPIILADSDRDGRVTLQDRDPRRSTWSNDFGAIFLPNIGHTPPVPPSNVTEDDATYKIHIVNNASGSALLHPELAAPLRTVALSKLPATAIGKLTTTAPKWVRLFCRLTDVVDGSPRWVLVTDKTFFGQIALSNGLILALDGRSVITDLHEWNGAVTVRFDVWDPETSIGAHDEVMLRISPLFIHHNLQPANLVLTRHIDNPHPYNLRRRMSGIVGTCHGFMQQMMATAEVTGVRVKTITARNNWLRDHFTVGYCAMPGPRKTPVIAIRVIVILPQHDSPETIARLFPALGGPTVGFHHITPTVGHIMGGQDSGGNIDVIPPHTSPLKGGESYPNGRLLMLLGDKGRKGWGEVPDEALTVFLCSQGPRSQGMPLFIHADLTAVNHIDEILTFVRDPRPGGTLPFTVIVADPRAGLVLLRRLSIEGNGHRLVPRFPDAPWHADRPQIWRDKLPQREIDDLLTDAQFLDANARAARTIDFVLRRVCDEVGIAPERVIRLPVVCVPHAVSCQPDAVQFLMPNPVNGLVLGSKYLAARQWGPVSGDDDDEEGADEAGVPDIFRLAVEEELRRVGLDVVWVDDYVTLHQHAGDVHCGTNTFREMERWW
ncbi:hypothetical protein QBC39DRAFT_262313 [Podospora conica]|nr:hypothetical protein QBC39DRAFT_262313 [Schizothecium conicum]